MEPLNYHQLYYFYKIAEHGSIAGASKEVLISSPALSVQLKELEESLGTPLFVRSGKKMELTEKGRTAFHYARDIFRLGSELCLSLKDEQKEVKIGCLNSVPKKVADDLVIHFIEKGQKVNVKEGELADLLKQQNNFELDFILSNVLPVKEHTAHKLLLSEEVMMVGHPKFKNVERPPLVLSSSCPHHIQENFEVVARVADRANEIDLAIKGVGLILTPFSSVKHLIEEGLLVIWKKTQFREEIWLISHSSSFSQTLTLS